jgi:diguanylate cyclase (GGDEF)-like protein/PAS domain S-box-containing protein
VDESLLRSVLDQGPEAIIIAELGESEPTVVFVNTVLCRLLSSTERDLVGRPLVVGASTAGAPVALLWDDLRDGRPVRWESVEDAGGDQFTAEWCFSPIRHGDGDVTHLAGILHDVTAQRREAERLEYLANHDILTGLLGRGTFEATLERLIGRASRAWDGAVLFVDVDRFKLVNDRFGHGIGDEVIRAVGARLSAALRPGDVLARLGGDEFGILLEDVSPILARQIAARVRAAAGEAPIRCGDTVVHLTVSGGLTAIEPGQTVTEAMTAADSALYAAKSEGRDRIVVGPRPRLRPAGPEVATSWHRRIAAAVSEERVELRFHPIRSLADGSLEAALGVPRLIDDEGLFASPSTYHALAARLGKTVALDLRIVDAVLALLEDPRHPPVLFPLTPQSLDDPSALDHVRDALVRHPVAAGRAVAVLAEDTLTADARRLRTWAKEAAPHGLSFAVTGIGQQAGTFRSLESVPVRYVELDEALVSDVRRSPVDRAMVRGIVSVARDTGRCVMAPRVTTAKVAEELRRLGVHCGHGPLWGAPRRRCPAAGPVPVP